MVSTTSREIDRRTMLALTAAVAALPACTPKPDEARKRLAVIGGGIIGASIAYHLARDGADVTLLERGEIAGRASRGTFAWINATWAKQPRAYHAFNQAGLSGWKRLQGELDLSVRWGGSLEWFPSQERQDRLAAQIAEQVEWGEPAEMLNREAAIALDPKVDFGDSARVAYSPNDGAVDPVLASEQLAAAAQRLGARIEKNSAVTEVSRSKEGGVTLQTSRGSVEADAYVLATGADPDATRQLAAIEIPQRSTPGVIVITKPAPRLINKIIVAPGVHIHQRDDGRIVLGEQDGAPDTAAHAERLRGRPTRFPDQTIAEQHAMRLLSIAEQFVPGILAVDVEDVIIGWRPLPIDGHPVIGRSPNQGLAYLAIMHSGVSLAPIVGELVSRELLSGAVAPDLEPYRPGRAFEAVRRY